MANGGRGGPSELRIGLVLYGGVSLAVYIFGVVVEIHRLLGISETREGGYGELLRAAEIETVTIDIAAGTSAGGINGILLAKALESGSDLAPLADVWRKVGDLEKLLQPPEQREPESLLQSVEFERELRDALERLESGETGPGPTAGVFDLFVSGTHIRGADRQFQDSLLGPIDTRQHRFVFQLKLREARTDPVDSDRVLGYEANDFAENSELTALARATSAFPVAFEPVQIGPGSPLLAYRDEDSGWFADGGILNNKPFTEALETIFARRSDLPVDRWLFSVDPDPPAAFQDAGPEEEPPFDQIALKSIASIPRYQSIVRDLVALRVHNERVQATEEAVRALEGGIADGAPPSIEEGSPAYATYGVLRRQALEVELADSLFKAVTPAEGAAERFDPSGFHEELRAVARQRLPSEVTGEVRDLAFEKRRAYYLIKLLSLSRAGEGDPGAMIGARLILWAEFERVTQQLWDRLSAPEVQLADPGEVPEALAARIDLALDLGQGPPTPSLAEMLADRSVQVEYPRSQDRGDHPVELAEVADRFELRDAVLLPAEVLGGMQHRDFVKHAQISPGNAKRISVDPKKKLGGATLHHFGGFLEEEWRIRDNLWGRLDTAEILVKAIARSIDEDLDLGPLIDQVQTEIVEELGDETITGPGWRDKLIEETRQEPSVGQVDRAYLTRVGYRSASVLRRMLLRAAGIEVEGGLVSWIRARTLRLVAAGLGLVLILAHIPARIYGRFGRGG